MKNKIKIIDWTGRVLFEGHYLDKQVDVILDANRCDCDDSCDKCDGTGYKGDFEVVWCDEDDSRNVYEYINY